MADILIRTGQLAVSGIVPGQLTRANEDGNALAYVCAEDGILVGGIAYANITTRTVKKALDADNGFSTMVWVEFPLQAIGKLPIPSLALKSGAVIKGHKMDKALDQYYGSTTSATTASVGDLVYSVDATGQIEAGTASTGQTQITGAVVTRVAGKVIEFTK